MRNVQRLLAVVLSLSSGMVLSHPTTLSSATYRLLNERGSGESALRAFGSISVMSDAVLSAAWYAFPRDGR